jgi:hypothetical protein
MAEQTKKMTVNVTYGWDTAEPKTKVELTLFPSTVCMRP